MSDATHCTVALFQGSAKLSDVVYNLGRIKEGMRKAAAAGADLIIFPELFLTEYFAVVGADAAGNLHRLAEEKHGASFAEISAAAKENGIAVVYGYPEVVKSSSGEEKYYNSAQMVDKDGRSLLNYRKTHLWANEADTFIPGDEFSVVDWNGIKLGILICYDVDFPEAVRTLALKGAHLVTIPTAIDKPEYEGSSTILVPARAMENGVYVAYVSYGGGSYWGTSRLVNPLGNTVVCAGSEEALLIAQISTNTVPVIAQYLHDRRPELYQEVVKSR